MRKIVHIELPSSDDAQAEAFYSELCGWNAQHIPMGEDFTYTMFDFGEQGLAFAPVGEETQPGDVMLYIGSDDLDADMARAEALGAQVVLPRQEVPGFGSFGIFIDLTGNRMAFWQAANPG